MKFEWIRTPKDIWESLSKEFPFTLDACASDKNALLNRYWTKKQDALKQSWNDEVIYCHPMYDQNIPKFIKKAKGGQLFKKIKNQKSPSERYLSPESQATVTTFDLGPKSLDLSLIHI